MRKGWIEFRLEAVKFQCLVDKPSVDIKHEPDLHGRVEGRGVAGHTNFGVVSL